MIDYAAFEAESLRLTDLLDETADECTKRMYEAAQADAIYRKEKAKAYLRATGTVGERNAKVDLATYELAYQADIAEGLLRSARDAQQGIHRKIELLRTRWSSAKAERI